MEEDVYKRQEYWLCCEVKEDYPKKSLLSAWE